jgi:hypothetical protein
LRSDVRLLIQIPCCGEQQYLADAAADVSRSIEGVDAIEVLVIDGGRADEATQPTGARPWTPRALHGAGGSP